MSVKSLRNTIFTAVAQCVTNKDVTDKLSELSTNFAEISSKLDEHPSLSLAMTAARGFAKPLLPN
jgi:hypothetical protein